MPDDTGGILAKQMKLAIMQPYLFPYLGYFQLVHAVDKFVFYDDVQYMKEGWLNRNRISVNKQAHLFTFSIKRDHLGLKINERFFSDKLAREKGAFLKTVRENYRRATEFERVYPVLEEILACEETNIARFNIFATRKLLAFLGTETATLVSSELALAQDLHGAERVIKINQLLGASVYLNAIGGRDLYDREEFARAGLELHFLQMRPVAYPQGKQAFIPALSMLDVLLHNPLPVVRQMLQQFELL